MTLVAESARAMSESVSIDTQPFAFIGNDLWGNPVRGRIDAIDVDAARGHLRQRGITAALEQRDGEPAPYTVQLSIAPRASASVGELVRRVLTARAARRG
ncbi:hypothetical protein L3i23_26990 [Herbiconiux sp. L3-i23]|nr:hypothetical protein L3i23_26990 [Herbiconiux sp. L3-i23]